MTRSQTAKLLGFNESSGIQDPERRKRGQNESEWKRGQIILTRDKTASGTDEKKGFYFTLERPETSTKDVFI